MPGKQLGDLPFSSLVRIWFVGCASEALPDQGDALIFAQRVDFLRIDAELGGDTLLPGRHDDPAAAARDPKIIYILVIPTVIQNNQHGLTAEQHPKPRLGTADIRIFITVV